MEQSWNRADSMNVKQILEEERKRFLADVTHQFGWEIFYIIFVCIVISLLMFTAYDSEIHNILGYSRDKPLTYEAYVGSDGFLSDYKKKNPGSSYEQLRDYYYEALEDEEAKNKFIEAQKIEIAEAEKQVRPLIYKKYILYYAYAVELWLVVCALSMIPYYIRYKSFRSVPLLVSYGVCEGKESSCVRNRRYTALTIRMADGDTESRIVVPPMVYKVAKVGDSLLLARLENSEKIADGIYLAVDGSEESCL